MVEVFYLFFENIFPDVLIGYAPFFYLLPFGVHQHRISALEMSVNLESSYVIR